MMEIKVQCDCGQRYKFDVQPANGQMPFTVQCPVCGADGTAKANVLIQEQMAMTPTAPPATAPPIGEASAPPEKPRLTLRRSQPAPEATGPVSAPGRPGPIAPMVISAPGKPAAAQPAGNFWVSVGGVVLGAVLGMILWHLVYRLTGWRLGFMALVTGCAAGVAPQLLGHFRGQWMGLIAAGTTLLAIFGAQFMNAKVQFEKFVDETESEGYEAEVEYAKRAVAAVPNGSESEMRRFLAKEYSDETDAIKPEEVEAEDVAQLREQLPRLQSLASGKMTRAEYGEELRKGSAELQETGVFKIYLLIRALGIFNIVNIVLGVGAAYLTAKG